MQPVNGVPVTYVVAIGHIISASAAGHIPSITDKLVYHFSDSVNFCLFFFDRSANGLTGFVAISVFSKKFPHVEAAPAKRSLQKNQVPMPNRESDPMRSKRTDEDIGVENNTSTRHASLTPAF